MSVLCSLLAFILVARREVFVSTLMIRGSRCYGEIYLRMIHLSIPRGLYLGRVGHRRIMMRLKSVNGPSGDTTVRRLPDGQPNRNAARLLRLTPDRLLRLFAKRKAGSSCKVPSKSSRPSILCALRVRLMDGSIRQTGHKPASNTGRAPYTSGALPAIDND